jgi:hypothetical protein
MLTAQLTECYLTDIYNDFKVTLGLAKGRLGGEYPVELLYNEWSDKTGSFGTWLENCEWGFREGEEHGRSRRGNHEQIGGRPP